MKKGSKLGRPRRRGLPSNRKAWGENVRPTELGAMLKAERVKRQIPQHTIAAALSKAAGGSSANVRVSSIELGKQVPGDKELAVLAKLYGLSVTTLKDKRDAEARQRAIDTQKNRAAANKKRFAETKVKGKPGPKPKAAQSNGHAGPSAPLAAGADLADWIDQIDTVAPMPSDREGRKRWLSCAMELLKLGGNGQQ